MAFIEPMHRNKPNITYLLTQINIQFELETGHVHSKYLIILTKQALFFNSKHNCQVINEN